MHIQRARGGRNIVIVFVQHTLDMLPFQVFNLHGLRLKWRVSIGRMAEGSNDLVGVGRLGQILRRTQLDGLDRRGDAGVTGQNHDARIDVEIVQNFD